MDACLKPERSQNKEDILMIGLDFGTTTSSAMVARARIGMNCTTGRMGFSSPEVIYRSESVFTPYSNDLIREDDINQLLRTWLSESGLKPEQLFSGGVMITGLAARHHNADVIARHARSLFGDIIVATADDPSLESWLAFMGGTSVLSRFHSTTPMINLDIGGGTTNPASGINGQVTSTGCSYIGARHFRFEPGTRILTGTSSFGEKILEAFQTSLAPGDRVSESVIDQILDFYVAGLVATVSGDHRIFETPVGKLHEQVPFHTRNCVQPVITYSGGVGELLYNYASGEPWPGTTCFGDLGVDLARRIAEHPLLSKNLFTHTPENRGRATVYGLTLHSTEISGTTHYISETQNLPLQDLPIVARLTLASDKDDIQDALTMTRKSARGACLQITNDAVKPPSLAEIKTFAGRMSEALSYTGFPPNLPLVLLVPGDYGKAIGNYISRWRTLPLSLTVIDEVPDRTAAFVNVGKPRFQIIPVSFYGMQ